MIVTLENEFIKLGISDLGAEMHSVFSKLLEREILWQADKTVWARHAPVLFPVVGKLKNNTYTYSNKKFSLAQHGFARDKKFKLKEQTSDSATFILTEDKDSLISFPFQFILQVQYRLQHKNVICSYMVTNPSENKLPFSIGAHPAFLCPLLENEHISDYSIQFEMEEEPERHLLTDGLQNGSKERIELTEQKLPLNLPLFEKDAIVLKHLHSQKLKLFSKNYCLHFSWHNMPFFGIWTKLPDAGFICLEPWAGIADSVSTTGEIETKEGIIILETNQQYECGFSFFPEVEPAV